MAESQQLDHASFAAGDVGQISSWRSIVTLIVFVITNIIVIFPFHIPLFVPLWLYNGIWAILSALRLISPRQRHDVTSDSDPARQSGGWRQKFTQLNFPMNMVTAPLIADLFLLAIRAIGREEVHDGTVGANNIVPLDIMAFFLTLAYIAISIDASGLVRYLAYKVLQKGGKYGHRLFFYLYSFFFVLGTFIGNDPIILSGTAFLAYMTRISSNIVYPRAWIYSQFAIANICSAILVSSNPTNLVLAGAFSIKFISYTANMIVPVVVTAIVLFPFLLYFIFADPTLIPIEIKMHQLSNAQKNKKPVNPNIPYARGVLEEEDEEGSDGADKAKSLPLEEVMNPFLDKGGAAFGAVVMATTLVTVLALNAASQSGHERPIFWVTLPTAFAMFVWDIVFGWMHRHETRELARKGREEIRKAREERAAARGLGPRQGQTQDVAAGQPHVSEDLPPPMPDDQAGAHTPVLLVSRPNNPSAGNAGGVAAAASVEDAPLGEKSSHNMRKTPEGEYQLSPVNTNKVQPDLVREGIFVRKEGNMAERDVEIQNKPSGRDECGQQKSQPTTLASLSSRAYSWFQVTFPTVTIVVTRLPWALIPFALSMFVLVQALVTKGWVQVFAYGWDHWVDITGIVGAIGGMGFLSVVLCNFAGTNIGTTILLSRVIQAWAAIRAGSNYAPISDRMFWGTVYSMALGVNYGAFSIAFSASLAGLLWRDILRSRHIHVPSLEFARVNVPIIAIAMTIGCAVLTGEIYIMRNDEPYSL